MRIAIVAGEPSGDVLAAGVIKQIKLIHPDSTFFGIGGEQMQAQGFDTRYSMETIALMGFESVIKDLKNILRIRKSIFEQIIEAKPDCFIGVDVPDFNLSLEYKLRAAGILVVHYVSPSVWAWRGYRIKKIKRSVDHMLTLFPFEKTYYDQHQIPATFVGHPTADKAVHIRKSTNRDNRANTIAILPGSRKGEVEKLITPLLGAAKLIHQRYPEMKFIMPFASVKLHNQFSPLVQASGLPIEITRQQSGQAFYRARLTLLASGTAALEAMIYGSMMVVVYKVGKISIMMFNLFRHVDHFSLPNQLLAKPEVPELSQAAVTSQNIYQQAIRFLEDDALTLRLENEFAQVSDALLKNTDLLAAQAILNLIDETEAC